MRWIVRPCPPGGATLGSGRDHLDQRHHRRAKVEHGPWRSYAMTVVISPTPWTAAATVMVQGATYYFEAQAELLAEALDAMTEWIAAA